MHHAYLLSGGQAEGYAAFSSLLEEIEFETEGNPDYFALEGGTFGIDEARSLSSRAYVKAFGERKVFLLAPERFTVEAQNALLKLLEEPPENTHFFILAREKELLIPTLLSRLNTVEVEGGSASRSEAAKFLKMNPGERVAFAKKFADSEENLSVFLDELLLEMKKNGASAEKLKRAFKARQFADDRSAMPRLILEHLALVI